MYLDADDAVAWRGLAHSEIQQGRPREAVDAAHTALALRFDLPLAHLDLGWAWFLLADYAKAEEALTTALRYAPELAFASLVRGVNGCIGQTHTPTILSGYSCGAIGTSPPGGNDPAFQANSLDWYWTQVLRTDDSGATVADGAGGFYYPWRGRIYDLGGEANRVALFPITDHVPLPCEAFEYSVWLSNDPDATEIAPETAPDPRRWNPARLIRAFTEGWTRNPGATVFR